MTIGIHVTSGPHKARISRTGYDDIVIGPDANQHFAAYPGMVVSVTEEATEGAIARPFSGGGPDDPPPPVHKPGGQ